MLDPLDVHSGVELRHEACPVAVGGRRDHRPRRKRGPDRGQIVERVPALRAALHVPLDRCLIVRVELSVEVELDVPGVQKVTRVHARSPAAAWVVSKAPRSRPRNR